MVYPISSGDKLLQHGVSSIGWPWKPRATAGWASLSEHCGTESLAHMSTLREICIPNLLFVYCLKPVCTRHSLTKFSSWQEFIVLISRTRFVASLQKQIGSVASIRVGASNVGWLYDGCWCKHIEKDEISEQLGRAAQRD